MTLSKEDAIVLTALIGKTNSPYLQVLWRDLVDYMDALKLNPIDVDRCVILNGKNEDMIEIDEKQVKKLSGI